MNQGSRLNLDVQPAEMTRLLERARRLRSELEDEGDPARDTELAEALETLRRLGGRPSLASETAEFARNVEATLAAVPGICVVGHVAGMPDGSRPYVLVTAGDQTFVVRGKGPIVLSAASVRRDLTRLERAVEDLRAAYGFLVVPDGFPSRVGAGGRASVATVRDVVEQLLKVR
jgi:hypothetical protein